jgi:hypothetical protein
MLKPFEDASVVVATPHMGFFEAGYSIGTHQMYRPSKCSFYWQGYTYIDDGRNLAVEFLLTTDYEYLLFVDSDIWMPERGLMQLYYADKDIVGGLYYQRAMPFSPVAFWNNSDDPDGRYMSIENEANGSGLLEVDMIGTGFMLIKRHVIEAFWDTEYGDMVDCGRVHTRQECKCRTCTHIPNCNAYSLSHVHGKFPMTKCAKYHPRMIKPFIKAEWGEDVMFCRAAGRMGFEVWCERDCLCRHITKAAIVQKEITEDGQMRVKWEPLG